MTAMAAAWVMVTSMRLAANKEGKGKGGKGGKGNGDGNEGDG